MKRLLIALLLLVSGALLFAQDDGGDPGYIPNYRELVREGYGPRHEDREDYYLRLGYGFAMAPKPTQAYYGKGYTIYYGYTAVPVLQGQANSVYAFGYPLEYFRHLMPGSVDGLNLSNYAVEVRNNTYGPGDYVAQNRARHGEAVTTVQKVQTTTTTATASGTNPLPPIGEKPAQAAH